MTIPKVGERLKIVPTYIENAEYFFVHILTPTWKQSLLHLNRRLNELAEKISLIHFNGPYDLPRLQDILFAQYIDGNFYRAKVISFYEETMEFKVFYCDYGHFGIVPVHHLRKWYQKYGSLPFQAILCKLWNVQDKPLYRREVTDFLTGIMLNKEFSALVKSNDNVLILDLETEIGQPTISQKLHESGLASPIFKEEIDVPDEEHSNRFLKRDKHDIPDYLR